MMKKHTFIIIYYGYYENNDSKYLKFEIYTLYTFFSYKMILTSSNFQKLISEEMAYHCFQMQNPEYPI